MYKYELKRKNSTKILDTKYHKDSEQEPWLEEIQKLEWQGRGLLPHNYEMFITECYEKEEPKPEPKAKKKKRKSTKKIRDSKNMASLRKAVADYLEELDA